MSERVNIGLLVARLIVGAIFIAHGWQKVNGIEGTAGFFAGLNIPMPTLMAYVVAYGELIGGILLILGLWTCLASLFLIIVMLVAIFTAHGGSFSKSEFPLSIIAALAVIMTSGAGKFALCLKKKGEVQQ